MIGKPAVRAIAGFFAHEALDDCWLESPLGALRLIARGDALVALEFGAEAPRRDAAATPFLRETASRLSAWFVRSDRSLDIARVPAGTPYQNAVWRTLCRTRPGETLSYAELALRAGGSARSAALACRANPWPIIVPCHRVVAHAGPGGYLGARTGRPLEIKRWLLAHESAHGG